MREYYATFARFYRGASRTKGAHCISQTRQTRERCGPLSSSFSGLLNPRRARTPNYSPPTTTPSLTVALTGARFRSVPRYVARIGSPRAPPTWINGAETIFSPRTFQLLQISFVFPGPSQRRSRLNASLMIMQICIVTPGIRQCAPISGWRTLE